MKKTVYILIVLLTLIGCVKEDRYPYKISDFRKELRINLESLKHENQLPSKDTIARNYLEHNCTKNELLKILNCESPLLRIIAYRTLVNRKEKDFYDILLNHLNDTATVEWGITDDVVGNFSVSDLMIQKAADDNKLSVCQKEKLVDSVLFNYPEYNIANSMIEEIKPQNKYYHIIKNRASIDNNINQMSACYALAKFKQSQDVLFLKEKFSKTDQMRTVFRAIEIFPHKEFFTILTSYYLKEINEKIKTNTLNKNLLYFCRAVASYKNDESLEILENIVKQENITTNSIDLIDLNSYVYNAIKKHPSAKYDKLIDMIQIPKSSTLKLLSLMESEENTTW